MVQHCPRLHLRLHERPSQSVVHQHLLQPPPWSLPQSLLLRPTWQLSHQLLWLLSCRQILMPLPPPLHLLQPHLHLLQPYLHWQRLQPLG